MRSTSMRLRLVMILAVVACGFLMTPDDIYAASALPPADDEDQTAVTATGAATGTAADDTTAAAGTGVTEAARHGTGTGAAAGNAANTGNAARKPAGNAAGGGGFGRFFQGIARFLTQILGFLQQFFARLFGGGQPAAVNAGAQGNTGLANTGGANPGTGAQAAAGANAVTGNTARGTGAPLSVRATGYYPPPPGGYKTKAEERMEGGALDCLGQRLRPLQNYNRNDPSDYVSCATDPRVIRTGTFFTLDQFPGVRFKACDVGGAIKGNHIDICCATRADTYRLPATVTVRTIR